MFAYLGEEQGIVGATKYQAVDARVFAHQFVEALFDEVIGTLAIGFIGLYNGSPKGTCLPRDDDVGIEFADFHLVTPALDGARCGHNAYVSGSGDVADDLRCGTNYAQYASRRIGGG